MQGNSFDCLRRKYRDGAKELDYSEEFLKWIYAARNMCCQVVYQCV